MLLQGGLVGLALFAWMVVALVREMAAGLAAGHRRAATSRRWASSCVAGFAIRNMTDDFLVRHNALLAWALAGAVLGRAAAYFRQNAGVKSTSIVKSSRRPRSMAAVHTQVWKSVSTA